MSLKSALKEDFEEQLLEKQLNEGVLLLKAALIYEDGRSHYCFNDNTSLIIHPNGDCFTYFTKDGKKLRQLVRYAVNNSSVQALTNGDS